MADRVILLNQGRIEQNGTPVELYEAPANTFVARFIGTPPMNLLPLVAHARRCGHRRHRRARRCCPSEFAGGMLGVRPGAHRARNATAATRRASKASSTSAAIRWSSAASARQRVAVRVPGASGLTPAMPIAPGLGRRRTALFRCSGRANPQARAQRGDGARLERRAPSFTREETMSYATFDRGLPRCAQRARHLRWRSRRRRSRFRSTTRWRSAGRSRRSSTATPPNSRRRIPASSCKPIYSGSYQESITKALTAVKSGEPPVTVDPAVDRHVHADRRGCDRAVRQLIKTADDRAWLKGFYPGFMENSQTGGKTWGIPFQRSTIVLYYNKEMFKEAGLDPNRPPQTWTEMLDYAQKLTKRDASGKVTQWGVQIPSSGFPYWLFQALAIENGVNLMNAAGTQTYYDKPEVIAALQYWVDLVRQAQGASGRHRRVGHDAEGLLRAEGGDDVDHHRQPHQREEQRQVRLRRRDAAGGQAARQPDRRRQLLHLQEVDARTARGSDEVHQVGDAARARGAVGHRHRLRRRRADCVGNAGDEEVRRRISRPRPSRATSCRTPRPSCRRTTTSA